MITQSETYLIFREAETDQDMDKKTQAGEKKTIT